MKTRKKIQVHVWRESDNERLYALFHRCAVKGDYWQPITGNLDPGESLPECALREAWEEAGIRLGAEHLSPALWVHDWSRDNNHFEEHIFALNCADQEIQISSEHRAVEWLNYEEALKRLSFDGNLKGLALVENWLAGRA